MKPLVLVTGATGFIGRRLVLLLAQDWTVRALSRDRAALLPGASQVVGGDITDLETVKAAAEGARAAVHLAALKSDEPGTLAVNVGGAINLIAACKSAGVSRVINVGTQASRLERRGAYGETKLEADRLFETSGLSVTTILPSLVYGSDDPGAFGKLARAVATAPFVPVIGDGSVRFHPIHVDDLARAIAACLSRPETVGWTFHAGGPDEVTLDGLIDLIGLNLGKTPRKVHIPEGAALLIARVLAAVSSKPPLSVSNVLGAVQSAPDADYAELFALLGFRPRALAEGMTALVSGL